jgi:phage terminase large subunit
MKDRGYWEDGKWAMSVGRKEYAFQQDNKLEFYSVDTYGKAHGPRRDVLFLNECNNLAYPIVDQLIVRTRKVVWLDWNPTSEFWFYTEMLGKREDVDFLTLTYKDNEALDEATKAEILSHRNNKAWWAVYGEGQLGEAEGRIFTGWQTIDEIPHEARLERYGLDFGYSNDPAAIVAIYKYNGGIILDQITYQKGLSNRQLADIIMNVPKALVIADSAEPKSIDEITSYGISCLPANKGQGSVLQGIQYVQGQRVSVTKRSTDLLKEYRNYLWQTDKDGKIINEPEVVWNHAMDAVRYGLESLNTQPTNYYNQPHKNWSIA